MPTTPSPSPRPERAVIGFFLYVTSILTFIIYVLWAYLPNYWLEKIGITYYPHKYWSIAMAGLIVSLLIGLILSNFLLNSLSIPTLDDVKLVHDRHTRPLMNREISDLNGTPPACDLDLAYVNQLVYSSDAK